MKLYFALNIHWPGVSPTYYLGGKYFTAYHFGILTVIVEKNEKESILVLRKE
jgi:hypothetical protein